MIAAPAVGAPCLTDKGLRLRYLPFAPHAKQAAFLATTCSELFWGGSGGGGKSAALLMGALQFADVPGYNALIIRRKLTDLTMPGALISMSQDWLGGRSDCKYNANDRKWTFTNGGTLQFGYLDHPTDVGRYRGPLHPETEILTEDRGWVRIDQIAVGDRVASFDPKTRTAGMQPVSATHEWDFDGELYATNQRSGVAFAMTPEHTVWYRTQKRPELRRAKISELAELERFFVPRNGTWEDGEDPDVLTFVPPNRKGPKVPTLTFTPDDWAEFLGWYVTEGHLGIGKEKNCVSITQKNPAGQARIEALLDRVGARWTRPDNRHYRFYNGALADYLREHCGHLAAGKRLPREVFSYSPRFRRILLDTIVDGDDSRYLDGKILYVTASKQLWNDVSELATRCGLTATSGTSPRYKAYGESKLLVPTGEVIYRVSITDRRGRDRTVKRTDLQRERYTGKVYCLTVAPWHSLIIRYKGRVSVTGNTEYHYIAFDEVGEIPFEESYLFLFSRRRRPKALSREAIVALYGEAPDGTTLLDVPLRTRAASNPGGPGSAWVKKRFVNPETRVAPFIPSGYKDNPAIDDEEYEASLMELDEVTRRQMMDGDWNIEEVPGALWKMEMFEPRDPWRPVLDPSTGVMEFDTSMFETVAMAIDPSVGEGAGDECGIVIGGQYADRRVVVLADESYAAHPDDWSATAIRNYHLYGCSIMVIEQNQGYEYNRTQLNNAADKLGLPRPRIKLVTAKGTKEQRAAIIQQAYVSQPPMMVHAAPLQGGPLEAQQVSWIPGKGKSPDRVDAVVHLGRHLLYPDTSKQVRPATTREKMMSWNA